MREQQLLDQHRTHLRHNPSFFLHDVIAFRFIIVSSRGL
jgi:hypothetical protein